MMVKAAIAFVLLGLGIGGCIKAVGFTNDFYNNRAETPLPPPGHSLGVEFGPNSGSDSCPTCLFVGSEDTLLDYYGKPIDVERLLYNTPTSILPLKTSYADHSTMNPKPTSTPPSNPDVVLCPVPTGTSSASTPFSKPTAHPPPASTLETTLGWLEFFLSWWFFPLQMVIYLAIGIATSGLVTQRSWGIFWLVASRFATSMLSKAAMAWIQRLQKNREIQRAKVTSSKAKTQLTIGTDAAQNAMVEDMTAIIHEHYQDPAKMMWAILGLLVARYGDACILTFSEEAFAPIVVRVHP